MFPNERDPGAGVFVLDQAEALAQQGIRPVIVSPTPWAPRWLAWLASVRSYAVVPRRSPVGRFLVERPRVLTLPKRWGFALSGVLFYLSCRGRLKQLLRREMISVIHAHTVMPDGFAAVLLGREFRIPVVCTGHGSDLNVYPQNSRLVRWTSRWTLRRVEKVVTVSDNLRRVAVELAGRREIAVVHNGADESRFVAGDKREARRRLHLRVEDKLVTFVGYLRSEKALDYLLRAFAMLARDDVRLALVGDGPLKPELMALAEELGISERCLFAGMRPHTEVPRWLAASDCMVLCSLSEGLPTILPEAMLCRVPVIATPVGGIPEVVRDGDTGLLVPCRDAAELAAALERVLTDTQLAQDLSRRAEVLARASLTWDSNARQMLAIYEQMVYTTTQPVVASAMAGSVASSSLGS
jgi:glycosyltransferase involved in cell wall biosynthesis